MKNLFHDFQLIKIKVFLPPMIQQCNLFLKMSCFHILILKFNNLKKDYFIEGLETVFILIYLYFL